MSSRTRLQKIQAKFRDTVLEEYLPGTDSWQQWLPAPASPADSSDNKFHMFDVDRFLSIYNRPVRRRQVACIPSPVMPASGLVRNPADGEMYIVGSERNDTNAGVSVEGLTVLHLVDSNSHQVEVFRRVRPAGGTDADPGWYDEVSQGTYWFDLELRTVSEEASSESVYTSKFFGYTSFSGLKNNDRLVFSDGSEMMVESAYRDAGFSSARLADVYDTRKDVVIEHTVKSAVGSGYNPHSNTTGGTTSSYNVTAWMGHRMYEQLADSLSLQEVPVYIDYENIGFVPNNNSKIINGTETLAVKFVRSNDKYRQYECICSRT